MHILIMPNTREDWLDQCLVSVQEATDKAGVPVQLYLSPGVEGHIGLARKAAFSLGTNPWVTWVDADDWLNTNAIDELVPKLSGLIGVSGRSMNVYEDGRVEQAMRGLLIARREDAASFAWENYPYCGTCSFADKLNVKYTESYGYFRRKYNSAASKLRGNRPCG